MFFQGVWKDAQNFIQEEFMEERNLTDEQNATEWKAPPPPEHIIDEREEPQMSEAATLGNIFFEPGRTFEDLRRKPRFILGFVLLSLLLTAYGFAFYYRVGEENFRQYFAQEIQKNPQVQSLPAEQKRGMIDLNMTITSIVRYLFPLLIIIGVALGALLYWLGIKAMGGAANYLHAVSLWVYSSIPPIVVATIANFIILFIKPVDEIDIATGQRTLLQANPSFFIDGKETPVLATLLATFDLFAIWGWILAAIGLRIIGKISSGAAWGIVIILALVSLTLRVLSALVSGNPM